MQLLIHFHEIVYELSYTTKAVLLEKLFHSMMQNGQIIVCKRDSFQQKSNKDRSA